MRLFALTLLNGLTLAALYFLVASLCVSLILEQGRNGNCGLQPSRGKCCSKERN